MTAASDEKVLESIRNTPHEVPISIDDIVLIKSAFANVGVGLLRALQNYEQEVNGAVLTSVIRANIDPNRFAGINLEKGVFLVKPQKVDLIV